jgi:hypothetical protein
MDGLYPYVVDAGKVGCRRKWFPLKGKFARNVFTQFQLFGAKRRLRALGPVNRILIPPLPLTIV